MGSPAIQHFQSGPMAQGSRFAAVRLLFFQKAWFTQGLTPRGFPAPHHLIIKHGHPSNDYSRSLRAFTILTCTHSLQNLSVQPIFSKTAYRKAHAFSLRLPTIPHHSTFCKPSPEEEPLCEKDCNPQLYEFRHPLL